MRLILSALLLAVFSTPVLAQLSPDTEAKIAEIAQRTLADTGVPSASVGVVMGGKVMYARAFGMAEVAPPKAAAASMAYPIGSISKQFTAQAALLLQQDGKLSLDDKVGKYFPELTRANEVSLRNLMTMTSGYEDFAPQDYIIPAWREPVEPLKNIREWAEKPLDFDPGTDWQYSNTNYVLLGLIVEKVAGEPLYKFIRERVLTPLGLEGVFNTYTERKKLEVTGYVSYAMAPVRVQPLEGDGWYFGDGDLAMPAATLLKWDLGVMNQSLLTAESYKEFETPFVLKNGTNTQYGLGTYVKNIHGHRMLEHSGEVGGYVSENIVFPEDKVAVVVLTNEVAASAAGKIGSAVVKLVDPSMVAAAAPADAFTAELKGILTGLQGGQIDRSLLTADCNDYFSAEALKDFASTLGPLGALKSVERDYAHQRGGMTGSTYTAMFANGGVEVSIYLKPDGKIEQLLVVGKA